jgi:hypothetical protein
MSQNGIGAAGTDRLGNSDLNGITVTLHFNSSLP